MRDLLVGIRVEAGKIAPVHVIAQRTRVVFQVEARFRALAPRKRWLEYGF